MNHAVIHLCFLGVTLPAQNPKIGWVKPRAAKDYRHFMIKGGHLDGYILIALLASSAGELVLALPKGCDRWSVRIFAANNPIFIHFSRPPPSFPMEKPNYPNFSEDCANYPYYPYYPY